MTGPLPVLEVIGDRLSATLSDFQAALTHSHTILVRAEVWRAGAKIADLPLVDGSVAADRTATSRRSFSGKVDPAMAPQSMNDVLTPYGNQVRIWRGIRFPDGTAMDYQIFFGRLDSVSVDNGEVSITCLDLSQTIADYRFETPRTFPLGTVIVDAITTLIQEVLGPAQPINIDPSISRTQHMTAASTFDRERTEAMDSLTNSLSCDWFAGPDGAIYIRPSPTIYVGEEADWIVRTGGSGVITGYTSAYDRSGVFNEVVATQETVDGSAPLWASARDMNPNSPTYWEGPFGKVPRFFASQFFNTYEQCLNAATNLLATTAAGAKGLTIKCVPNPALMLDDIIQVIGLGTNRDGLYFVQSFDCPVTADGAMTINLQTQLISDTGGNLRGWTLDDDPLFAPARALELVGAAPEVDL